MASVPFGWSALPAPLGVHVEAVLVFPSASTTLDQVEDSRAYFSCVTLKRLQIMLELAASNRTRARKCGQ